MSLIPAKIKQCRIDLGMTQEEMAVASGFAQRDISRFETGRAKTIPNDFIQFLHKRGVNLNRLFDETFDASPNASLIASPTAKNQNEKYISEVAEEPAHYATKEHVPIEVRTQPLLVTVDSHGKENIVVVESRAAAGYVQHYMEPEFVRQLPAFSLPRPEFRNATFRCFEVTGSSMAKTFYSGELVIGSFVDNWPQNIKNGYVYVIVTPYAILIKRVLNRVMERGRIVLQSDNEEYETQEVDALDVLELWYVRASLRFKFPNTRFEVARKVGDLEADVSYLKKQVNRLLLNEKKG